MHMHTRPPLRFLSFVGHALRVCLVAVVGSAGIGSSMDPYCVIAVR